MAFDESFLLILLSYLPAIGMTLSIALSSLCCGLGLAAIFCLLELQKSKLISIPTTIFVTIIRSLPEILIVVSVYSGIPIFFDLLSEGLTINLGFKSFEIQSDFDGSISPFVCAIIALSLLYASYASQTLRGAFKSIQKGQFEAGKSLAMKKTTIFFELILSQTLWRSLPGLTNQWLVLLKDTALVSLITVNDIMFHTQNLISRTHKPFTFYFIAMILYWLITLLSQQIILWLDKRNHFLAKGK